MNRSFYGRPSSHPYDGVILKTRKVSAKQLLVTVYTKQKGLLQVLARRSSQGKMGYGALSPLSEITFDVLEKDDAATLTEYDCRSNQRLLHLTWDAYVYSQIFVEIVLFMVSPGEQDETIYNLVRLYGRAIELKDPRIVTIIAGWQLVALTGFLPDIQQVPVFAGGQGYGGKPAYYLGAEAENMRQISVSPATRQTWQTLVHYAWGRQQPISLRRQDLGFLEILLYNYVSQCRERKMKAPNLLFTQN